MKSIKPQLFRILICFIFFGLTFPEQDTAQSLNAPQIDSLANKAIKAFNVPGMSIALVKDGKVIYAKGYGIQSIITKKPVDENTLFGIASNSKAFTAAALGILVNEGKIQWDDKVIDYLPEFKMYDPYVTAEFTIRDLLTHRSGLGLYPGDLMHNPDSTDFTIKDIIHNLRYLKPAASFRSRYAYDNIFYLVAGELIARVSGMSWGDFIEKRIFAPLKMNDSRASYLRAHNSNNLIDAHSEVNGKLETIIRGTAETDAGAGGIYSSAADMGKWMLLQLNHGKYGPGLNQQLFSEAIHHDMWSPQVVIPVGRTGSYDTHFGAYGLGWFLIDAKGKLEVFHTGQDDGMISEIEMIPELNFGIVVLTNQEGGGAVRAVTDQVTDSYLGIKGNDRIKEYADRINQITKAADTVTAKVWQQVKFNQETGVKPDTAAYTGLYRDNWFGDVTIDVRNHQIWFKSKRSLQLKGQLFFYKGNTFVVKWNNPQLKATAFVLFTLNENGTAAGMTMKAVSAQNAAGFDFQDLNFQRADK
jgi:CubicO group peptidase (beta-lactamase class C family)